MARETQRKVLYLGLDPSRFKTDGQLVHCPLIHIKEFDSKKYAWLCKKIPKVTHVICTSRSCAAILLKHFPLLKLKPFYAIGNATAQLLKERGVKKLLLSKEEYAESLVEMLMQGHNPSHCYLYPHSSLARSVIGDWLKNHRYYSFILYETHYNQLYTDLKDIDEIVFTSPSTVDAFIKNYGFLPSDKKLTAIGPITLKYLNTLAKNGNLHMVET